VKIGNPAWPKAQICPLSLEQAPNEQGGDEQKDETTGELSRYEETTDPVTAHIR
jgi:hypothetical protein